MNCESEILGAFTDLATLKGELAKLQKGRREIDPKEMKSALKRRVRGQDQVVDECVNIVHLGLAKEIRSKPIASLLFVGPKGAGKTELAKAMAHYLYGSDKHMLRFDCGALQNESSVHQLVGIAGPYKNSEKGGELTRPVMVNPKRLILFDEIEKAYSPLFDIFLSILDEGQLREPGASEPADFTQSIIVFTSNVEYQTMAKIQEEHSEDRFTAQAAMKKHLGAQNKFRPELLDRISRICVFKPLEGLAIAEIVAMKMQKVASECGIELQSVAPQLIVKIIERMGNAKEFSPRSTEDLVNEEFGATLLAARNMGCKKIRLTLGDDSLCQVEKVA
jgi:ATP-dependent Clp protease ATP-binding subunit ClpA